MYLIDLVQQQTVNMHEMKTELSILRRNQEVEAFALLEQHHKLNMLNSDTNDLQDSALRLNKKTCLILSLMTDPFLADLPFNSQEDIFTFFSHPRR